MCEFCTKHGDGQVWYKNAANYSNDLLSDLKEGLLSRAFSNLLSRADLTISEGLRPFTEKKAGCLERSSRDGRTSQREHFGQSFL